MRADFEFDRGKGFYTAADKRYLLEESGDDLDANARRQKRKRLRDRTRNAYHDFRLAFEHLDDEEIGMIFDLSEADAHEAQMFERGLWAVLALTYQAVGQEKFVDLLEEAIARVKTGGDDVLDGGVDVRIEDVEAVNIQDLAEKLDSGPITELTNAEISVLFRIMQRTGGTIPSDGDELRERYVEFLDEELRTREGALQLPETGFPDLQNVFVREHQHDRKDPDDSADPE